MFGCTRWLPLAEEGDVEQEGISSVSADRVAPGSIIVFPVFEITLVDEICGKAVSGTCVGATCFCKGFHVALAAWVVAVGLSALKKFCSPVEASLVAAQENANWRTAVACLQENFAAPGLAVIVRV